MTLDECRRFYAEEIRFVANIDSPALIEALARVPREKFLGPGPWQVALPRIKPGETAYTTTYITIDDPRQAYHNVLIALDPTRGLNNGQPSALASWINKLDLKTGERVFHVGCGTGYYTAVMAELVGPGGSVVASEVHPHLAARAKENLASYPNVTVHTEDGAVLDPGACDAMFINAGVTHPHPPWLARLNEGGRIVFPLATDTGGSAGAGLMVQITRNHESFGAEIVGEVGIYLCTSVRDPRLEPLIEKALETGALRKLKSVRRDSHEETDTCLLHREDVCLSSAEPVAKIGRKLPRR